MRAAGVGSFLFGVVVLIGGIVAFIRVESLVFLVSGIVIGLVYLMLARSCFRGIMTAGYVSGALTFLSAIYLAYRLIASQRFFPSGALLILSFLVLFVILLGVFLGLQAKSQSGR
jgi:uncharacterized membrane protein (UPF0136 family)